MTVRAFTWMALAGTTFGVTACMETSTTALEPETELLSVVPQGGAVDVDPSSPVVVTFDHAINPIMVEYAALHEGDVTGPEVAGTWSLSDDGTELTFTQDAPLKPATDYTIHLGGNMMDATGEHVDMATHGEAMGGMWADGSMMAGGMMGGSHQHMGSGWQDPDNGSYGMVFTFTTAAPSSMMTTWSNGS